eukprot:scaffold46425_cov16-Tisochrysis_lutea.AAC.3
MEVHMELLGKKAVQGVKVLLSGGSQGAANPSVEFREDLMEGVLPERIQGNCVHHLSFQDIHKQRAFTIHEAQGCAAATLGISLIQQSLSSSDPQGQHNG